MEGERYNHYGYLHYRSTQLATPPSNMCSLAVHLEKFSFISIVNVSVKYFEEKRTVAM